MKLACVQWILLLSVLSCSTYADEKAGATMPQILGTTEKSPEEMSVRAPREVPGANDTRDARAKEAAAAEARALHKSKMVWNMMPAPYYSPAYIPMAYAAPPAYYAPIMAHSYHHYHSIPYYSYYPSYYPAYSAPLDYCC